MNQFAIIVAGGSGSRMGRKTPKQFMTVGGKPILMLTLERFFAYSPSLQVILVLPPKEIPAWHILCDKHSFYPAVTTVNGGATRFESVRNGLKAIRSKEGLVAVHDGVRPFVTADIIKNSFDMAAEKGTAVTCVALKDSVRLVNSDGSSQTADRADYRLIQTPQTFRLDWMRQSFDTQELPHFTDCASVLEQAGFAITLIEGAYENIKLTTPEDLLWAEVFLNSNT